MSRSTFQTQGIELENVANPDWMNRKKLLRDAKELLCLREELIAEDEALAERRMKLARDYANPAPDRETDEE
jgi:hypothetical protein